MIFLIEDLQAISQYRSHNDVIILYICWHSACNNFIILIIISVNGYLEVYCYRMSFLKLYEQSVINFIITSLHSMGVIY